MTVTALMWIEESKDPYFGFGTSGLLVDRTLGGLCPDALTTSMIDRIIVGCGSKEDAVRLLFGRMKANLKQFKPDLESFLFDLLFISHQLVARGPSIPPLQGTFLSNSSHTVVCIVDTITLILGIQSNEPKHLKANPLMMDVIGEPLITICCIFRSWTAYEKIAQLLQTSFFSLVARAALVCWPIALARKFDHGLATLLEILIRFAVHRPLLSAMNRCLAAAFKTHGVPGGPIGNSLHDFQTNISHWDKMKRKYRDGICGIAICGDPEVCLQFVAIVPNVAA